ncbi:helix-turn-helix domain-containing protein [Leptospira langatensis]|nr:AraC family transcriptional regulator [Leptospira langatensis]
MEKNFDKRLSIEDYSILTGRSISSFQRDFKKIYGLSPKKWLTIQRMKKAKELLENGGASVTDVALSIGYENISHFIRAFQEQYEVTPGEFLKKEIRVR